MWKRTKRKRRTSEVTMQEKATRPIRRSSTIATSSATGSVSLKQRSEGPSSLQLEISFELLKPCGLQRYENVKARRGYCMLRFSRGARCHRYDSSRLLQDVVSGSDTPMEVRSISANPELYTPEGALSLRRDCILQYYCNRMCLSTSNHVSWCV